MPDAIVERDGHLLIVTMNRPSRLNALSGAMLIRMIDAFVAASSDPEIRCIVLTGAGGNFCSGADLRAMAGDAGNDDPEIDVSARLAADPDLGELVDLFVQEMPDRIDALDAQAKSRNWSQLAETAHQIKGAAGCYGFDAITPCAARLEAAAREAQQEEQILSALDELLSLCRRVRSGKPQAEETLWNTAVPVSQS